MRVGNGGFSLRSRKLLAALQDPRIALVDAEDTTIGRTFRPLLERDHGIRFADEALADRFSFEAAYPIGRPFGFHGLFNFCRTVPPAEIAAMAPTFSDAIARSPQLLQLLRNCIAHGAMGRRARDCASHPRRDTRSRRGAGDARHGPSAAQRRRAAVGRNDPCPCGSGKKVQAVPRRALGTGRLRVQHRARRPRCRIDSLVRAAIAAHQRGDLDGAERGYRDALALAPAHPMATHYLGVVLYQRGRIDDALPLLQAAVDRSAAGSRNSTTTWALRSRRPIARRSDRRLSARARAAAGARDRVEQPRARPAGRKSTAAKRSRRSAAPSRSRRISRRRTGTSASRCSRTRNSRRDGANTNGVIARPSWRAHERALARAALGRRRTRRPHAARHDRSKVWATRCNSSVSRKLLAARGARVLVSAPGAARPVACDAHPAWRPSYGPDETPTRVRRARPADRARRASSASRADVDSCDRALPRRRSRAARGDRARARPRTPASARSASRGRAAACNTLDRRRSIPLAPARAALRASRTSPGSRCKRRATKPDIEHVPAAQALHRLPAREDFDGMAALVAELDLVISVDTSIAHLGGALARPTWVMLACGTDWRWHPRSCRTARGTRRRGCFVSLGLATGKRRQRRRDSAGSAARSSKLAAARGARARRRTLSRATGRRRASRRPHACGLPARTEIAARGRVAPRFARSRRRRARRDRRARQAPACRRSAARA